MSQKVVESSTEIIPSPLICDLGFLIFSFVTQSITLSSNFALHL